MLFVNGRDMFAEVEQKIELCLVERGVICNSSRHTLEVVNT